MKKLLTISSLVLTVMFSSTSFASGPKYIGEYKDGREHGQGTFTSSLYGSKYVGEYRAGKMHGQGTMTYANGDKYVGGWKDGEYHGQGTFTYASGSSSGVQIFRK